MKKFTFILLLSIAVLASCSKSEDDSSKPGAPALMRIKLEGSKTKAVGVPNPVDEAKVTTGMVFVFRGGAADPILDGMASFDFTTVTAPVNVKITAGNDRLVYVVANVDTMNFLSISKRSDLYNLLITYKASLDDMQSGVSLAMSGSATVDASGATMSNIIPVTVPLSFVGSRIHLQWNTTGFIGGTIAVTGVYLLNVKSHSDFFAPAGSMLSDNVNRYLFGQSPMPGGGVGQFLPQPPATNNFSTLLQLSDLNANGFGQNFFYVLENNSNFPTIAVIEATIDGVTNYYPTVINGGQNGSGFNKFTNNGDGTSTVKRGNIYYVNVVINGFGNDNPYEPMTKGILEVTVVAAEWNPVIQIDQVFE